MTQTLGSPKENAQFMAFIQEQTPTPETLEMHAQSKDLSLKVPSRLNSQKEEHLMAVAFRYLFYLNVARETGTGLDIEKLRAIEGNRLVKKKHPLNFFYDLQFVAAKTQIKGYLHNAPYTVPYNQRALRIYGRCFLFAQLDLVAQAGEAPDKLGSNFYFLPKGSFTEEFEQLNELALAQYIPQLSSNDHVQFYPSFAGDGDNYTYTSFLLNETFVQVDTSEHVEVKRENLEELVRLFFLQKINQKQSAAPTQHTFSKLSFYRARFGEMLTLDLEAYFGETLNEKVEAAQKLLQ